MAAESSSNAGLSVLHIELTCGSLMPAALAGPTTNPGGDSDVAEGFVRSVGRLVAWCLTALLALVLMVVSGSADARPAPQPTPSGQPRPAATSKAKLPGLGLSLNPGGVSVSVGSVHVNVKVPVDLNRLLGGKPSTSPAPTSKAPKPTTTPATVTPTSRAASSAHELAGSAPQPGSAPRPATHTNGAYPPTMRHVNHPTASATTHASQPAQRHPATPPVIDPRVAFARGDFAGNDSVILILLCVMCGVGVAVVVRLSGGRRRL